LQRAGLATDHAHTKAVLIKVKTLRVARKHHKGDDYVG
jgi:hypothetical protein